MTDIQICNAAMAALGHDQEITSLIVSVDTSAEALKCSHFYDLARQVVLRERAWGFATHTEILEDQEESDHPKWQYSYPRPGDCLRFIDVLDLSGNHVPYELHDADILTDAVEGSVSFVFDEDDTALFDPMFTQALIYKLASMLAAPLTGKPQLTRSMHELFATALGDASHVEANEDRDRGAPADPNYYVTARN